MTDLLPNQNVAINELLLVFFSALTVGKHNCCVTVVGGALAPLSFSDCCAHFHPADVVAMVPRES